MHAKVVQTPSSSTSCQTIDTVSMSSTYPTTNSVLQATENNNSAPQKPAAKPNLTDRPPAATSSSGQFAAPNSSTNDPSSPPPQPLLSFRSSKISSLDFRHSSIYKSRGCKPCLKTNCPRGSDRWSHTTSRRHDSGTRRIYFSKSI